MQTNAPQPTQTKKFSMTIPEAAEHYSISEKRLRQMIQKYPDRGLFFRNGRKWLIICDEMENFLRSTTNIFD